MLHGFASLEVTGGFRFDTDVDESFTWMNDHGLQEQLGGTSIGGGLMASE